MVSETAKRIDAIEQKILSNLSLLNLFRIEQRQPGVSTEEFDRFSQEIANCQRNVQALELEKARVLLGEFEKAESLSRAL